MRLRRIHARPDYEVAGTAAFDYVAGRGDVDAKRVVVMATASAATCHAHCRHRAALRGGVALGAMRLDMHTRMKDAYAKLATNAAASPLGIPIPLGVGAPDNDAALEIAKRYTLEGIADKVACRSSSCMARTTGWCRSRPRISCTRR